MPNDTNYDLGKHHGFQDSLATALLAQIDAVSATLAGDPDLEVSAYEKPGLPYGVEEPLTAPASSSFADGQALVRAIRAGDPAALETGLSILPRIALAIANDLASTALSIPPWPRLLDAALAALSKVPTARAFLALLENVEAPRGAYFVESSAFPEGCKLVVDRLRKSPVLRVPPLPEASVSDLASLSESSRAEFLARVEALDSAVPSDGMAEAEALLAYATVHCCTGARDVVTRIYREHPSESLRLSAGHVLTELADEASLGVLASGLRGWHERTRWFAVKAIVQRDPAHARATLGGDALRRSEYAERALHAFELVSREAGEAADPTKAWIRADPGWLDLALHWVSQKGATADAANELLQLYSKVEIAAAKKRAKAAPAAKKTRTARPPAPSDIDDALSAGDLPRAWSLLARLGDSARTAKYAESARAVARETMLRVRRNLERIVERLREHGYVFRHPDRVLAAPLPDARKLLDRIEKLVGPMPIALRAAYEIIGACNLQGTHPAWPAVACIDLPGVPKDAPIWSTDPLVLVSLRATAGDADDLGHGRSLNVLISGDAETKAGYSGGTYGVRMPDGAADPPLDGAGSTLVGHLRQAIAHGGFAGFAKIADRPEAMLRALTDGLEPI